MDDLKELVWNSVGVSGPASPSRKQQPLALLSTPSNSSKTSTGAWSHSTTAHIEQASSSFVAQSAHLQSLLNPSHISTHQSLASFPLSQSAIAKSNTHDGSFNVAHSLIPNQPFTSKNFTDLDPLYSQKNSAHIYQSDMPLDFDAFEQHHQSSKSNYQLIDTPSRERTSSFNTETPSKMYDIFDVDFLNFKSALKEDLSHDHLTGSLLSAERTNPSNPDTLASKHIAKLPQLVENEEYSKIALYLDMGYEMEDITSALDECRLSDRPRDMLDILINRHHRPIDNSFDPLRTPKIAKGDENPPSATSSIGESFLRRAKEAYSFTKQKLNQVIQTISDPHELNHDARSLSRSPYANSSLNTKDRFMERNIPNEEVSAAWENVGIKGTPINTPRPLPHQSIIPESPIPVSDLLSLPGNSIIPDGSIPFPVSALSATSYSSDNMAALDEINPSFFKAVRKNDTCNNLLSLEIKSNFHIESTSVPARKTEPSCDKHVLNDCASIRERGNAAFRAGDYAGAELLYTKGIDFLPPRHSLLIPLWNNRASALLKTGQYLRVVDDCNNILVLSPRDAKALLKRALAWEGLEKWREAYNDHSALLLMDPTSSQAKVGAIRCQRALSSSSVTTSLKDFDFTRSVRQQNSGIAKNQMPSRRDTAFVQQAVASAVGELRQKAAESESEDVLKFSLKDKIEEKVQSWSKGKETNLRALLSSIGDILWPELQWKEIALLELITPQQVKIKYMKAVSKLHPDKISKTCSLEHKLVATEAFTVLSRAWEDFRSSNSL